MFDTYKPSGKFGGMTIPLVLVGAVVAVALAYAYHLLLEWIPLIYVNFLATLFFAIGLGMIGSWIVGAGHIRNRMIAVVMGVLLALSALSAKYYFQHQTFCNQIVDAEADGLFQQAAEPLSAEQRQDALRELKKLVRQEVGIADHLKLRVDQGWNIGRRGNGAPVNGIFVYLVWLVEAGMLLYYAVTNPLAAAGEPYSEKLNAWASEEEAVMTLPVTDDEMVAKIQSASSVDDLLSIPIPKTDQSDKFAIYRVNSLEGQEMEDAYLSVDLLELSVNSKGEQETKSTSLVKHAILSSEQRKQLVENSELMHEAIAAYRESLNAEASAETDSDEEVS